MRIEMPRLLPYIIWEMIQLLLLPIQKEHLLMEMVATLLMVVLSILRKC
jgi:hypothetical protein